MLKVKTNSGTIAEPVKECA